MVKLLFNKFYSLPLQINLVWPIKKKPFMNNNKSIFHFVFLALATVTTYSTYAAVGSDLKVIQAAAQTGVWTVVTTGNVGEMVLPNMNETACLTKAEILQSFNHALMVSDGEESKECPTKLTVNSVMHGVAIATCPAKKLVVGGRTFNFPETTLKVEFDQIGENQWAGKMDNRHTTFTFHGSATANCIKNR